MTNVDWEQAVDGDFANGASWSGGAAPNAADNAVLNATGGAFNVGSSVNEVVLGVQLSANATLAISGGTFTAIQGTDGGLNAGQIAVTAGAELAIGGTIDNAGRITLSGAGFSTGSTMVLTSATTLTGGGQVSLVTTNASYEATIAAGKKAGLTNVDNTITGTGVIGASAGFHLVNNAAGVIEGGVTLGSWATPGLSINNSGVIEATSLSKLDIYGATISGKGGLLATQGGAIIEAGNCTIAGQTLRTAASSSMDLEYSSVTMRGKIQDAGGIQLQHTTATLIGATTLSGGGYLTLSSGAEIIGASAGAMLQNAGDKINLQGGNLGGGDLSIFNAAGGSIAGFGSIASGANTIVNAGAIVASNGPTPGLSLVISGPIDNEGTLSTSSGATLIAQGAVAGPGELVMQSGVIGGSVAEFTSAFSEDVSFVLTGKTAKGYNPVSTLELGQSQGYNGSVSGFSQSGLTALDLADIAFVSRDEASFSGDKSSGMLTISDGAHTARINLVGNFTGAAFTASSDGHGGTTVVATVAQQARAGSPHAFIAAMSSLGAPPTFSARAGEELSARPAILFAPR